MIMIKNILKKKVCAQVQTTPSRTREGCEVLLAELEGYHHLEAYDPDLGYTHHARVANCLWQLYLRTTAPETKQQYLTDAELEIKFAVMDMAAAHAITKSAIGTPEFLQSVTAMPYVELNQLMNYLRLAETIYEPCHRENPFVNLKHALTPFIVESEPFNEMLQQYSHRSQEMEWGLLKEMVLFLIRSCDTVASSAIKMQRLRAAEEFSIKCLDIRPYFIDAMVNQCTLYCLLQKYSQTEPDRIRYLRKGLESHEATLKVFRKFSVPPELMDCFCSYLGQYHYFLCVNSRRPKPVRHASRIKLAELQYAAIEAKRKKRWLVVK